MMVAGFPEPSEGRTCSMLPALDLPTNFLTNAIITGVAASMLGFIRHANRDLHGLGYWMLGQASQTIGFGLLFCITGTAQPHWGIVGFLFILGGDLLGLVGYYRFLNVPVRPERWAALLFILTGAAFVLLSLTGQPLGIFRVLMLGVQVVPTALSAYVLIHHGQGAVRTACRTVGGFYVAWAALCGLRALYLLAQGLNDGAISWTLAPAIAIATLILTCHALGLAWMVVGRLQENLIRQAATDPLTGAMNRRALQSHLEQETNRAARDGQGLTVVMFDLDHFKALNDTHGHAVGDATLAGVVELTERMLRPGDGVARLGGEEFCLVLSGLHGPQATTLIERLRLALQDLDIASPAGPVRVAASFGIAWYGPHGHNWSGLLKAADNALYQAKRSGRDRVELAAIPDGIIGPRRVAG